MRVLHVIESLDRGGLERTVADIAIHQRRSGVEASVFCLFKGGPFESDLVAAGVPLFIGYKRPGLDVRAIAALRTAIRASQADVVHSHNPVANYYAAITLALPPWRPPLVNTRHNMGPRDSSDPRERLFRISLLRTCIVAHVSQQSADRFIQMGVVPRSKAVVVRNGIPFGRYAHASRGRSAMRKSLGVESTDFLVGTVGRLVPVKNHELLLEAAAVAMTEVPELRIVLVGGGPLLGHLRDHSSRLRIQDKVTFLAERSDVPDLLGAMDLFALPSLSEGHSIALLEASAVGLPIVATAVGGNPEILEDNKTGILVPSGSIDQMANAIIRMRRDAIGARRMGDAARSWCERSASMEAMASGYTDVYTEAARR